MKALAILLIFGGYTLVYAAVANRGRFATDPWAGLFADAYTSNVSTGAESAAASAASAAAASAG